MFLFRFILIRQNSYRLPGFCPNRLELVALPNAEEAVELEVDEVALDAAVVVEVM